MSTARWRRIERNTTQDYPFYLDDSDMCVFAREYISRGGYKASDANSLISNLKMGISYRDKKRWHYKERAIKQFATEALPLFPNSGYIITGIPSSKCPADSEYDDRIERVCRYIELLSERKVRYYQYIYSRTTTIPKHAGGARNPESTILNYAYNTPIDEYFLRANTIIVIDDVITSGCNFLSTKRFLFENIPKLENVKGAFWAHAVSPMRDIDL